MGTALLLAMIGYGHGAGAGMVSGNMEWEETALLQRLDGYHPKLRLNPSSTFVFVTPYFTAEGHYERDGDHFTFRPEMAAQLNHADVDKLVADLGPEERAKEQDAYAKSLIVFNADYDEQDGVLNLAYRVGNMPRKFMLHAYTEGDDQLMKIASGTEAGMVGLWNAPEPFPDRLDSKTRYRIGGLDGLSQFSKEGIASDGAQFGLLDLRSDKSFRMHQIIGKWQRNGSNLKLSVPGEGDMNYTVSPDGTKILMGGRPAFVRN